MSADLAQRARTAKILIADDDRGIRTVLHQAMARLGHEVETTGNASTLWRWVADGRGDLLITDVVFPDGDALDLLPRIKQARPALLRAGDLLVVNDTRVLNARLEAQKASGGRVEVMQRRHAEGGVHLSVSEGQGVGMPQQRTHGRQAFPPGDAGQPIGLIE